MEKRRDCSLGAISPLSHNIVLPVVRFSYLSRDKISLRDKRLFEIREVEITRVNCIWLSIKMLNLERDITHTKLIHFFQKLIR